MSAGSLQRSRAAEGTTARLQLVTDAEIEKLPDPRWLVEKLLPEQALAVLYGQPGDGKSFLALDLALAVATGQKWLGHSVHQGAVLYIAAEGSSGLKGRIRAWKLSHAISGSAGVLFSLVPVQLVERGDVEALLEAVKRQLPPQWIHLVVVDTLAMCFVGRDENAAKEMGELVAAASALRHATGGTVLLVHHSGKRQKAERGSSALKGAADTMIRVTKRDNVLTLHCDKQKDSAPFEPIHGRLAERFGSCVVEAIASDAATRMVDVGLKPKALQCLNALAAIEGDTGATASAWQQKSGLRPSTFFSYGPPLAEQGYVTHDGKLYRLTEKGLAAIPPTPTPLSVLSH
jgi:RecA/RadA recombinase